MGVKALLTSSLVWFYEVSESVITYNKNNKECGFQNVADFLLIIAGVCGHGHLWKDRLLLSWIVQCLQV